jgi:alkanesulfonate monooxygenase
VAAHIADLRAVADHPVRFAVRLHVITRDTSGQAWAEARRLLAALGEGPDRLVTAHGRDAAQLEVYPNLWAGAGLVPGGADLALVGNHAQVADRITEYRAAGVDEFVLSGRPALEEAYWFTDGVLPRLARHPAPVAV